jgi:hypothetical protein
MPLSTSPPAEHFTKLPAESPRDPEHLSFDRISYFPENSANWKSNSEQYIAPAGQYLVICWKIAVLCGIGALGGEVAFAAQLCLLQRWILLIASIYRVNG